MKTVCEKLLSLMLVAVLLVSAVPFQAFAAEGETNPTETTTAVETTAATEAVAVIAETTAATEASAETTAATEAPAETTTATEAPAETTEATEAPAETTEATEAPVETTAPTTDNKNANTAANDGPRVTIYLDPQGGTVSSFTHSVVVGQSYNYVSTLPTPKRDHYDFQYWNKFTMSGYVPVNGDTIVTDSNPLYAQWKLKNYNVRFERYDGTQWVGVKSVSVPAVSTLTTANGFPTESEITNNFSLSGYTIVGWEIGESDKAFTAGATLITSDMVVRPRYQRTVTLMANNPNNYTSNSTKSITVEIGEPIPSLPNPGARDGYTFVDWVAEDQATVISNKANLTNVNAHPKYYPALGTTFYARWTESTVVYLYIHTNGNTQTATKIVPYYEAPTNGAFDTSLINMYSIFSEYGKYDDNGDAAYGWYDATQWKNYCANTAANAATVFYNIKDNDYIELHIMLIDNGNNTSGNNYNNNTSTADPSNPTTGDMVMMAVTVMAVSAAALALIFFTKKRKASK